MERPRNATFQAVEGTGEAVVDDFVGVMRRLRTLFEEENDLLSRGMPATILGTTARKGQLSEEYALLGDEVAHGARRQILSDPSLHEKLVKAGVELRALSEENRQLLANALVATRRRVDAVMEAVRAVDNEDAEQGCAASLPGEGR